MTLLQTWIDYVNKSGKGAGSGHESSLEPEPANIVPPAEPIYFASTSLDLRRVDSAEGHPPDIYIENVCYRRVDPPYYAWLRRRMEKAKRAIKAGRLPKAKWDTLRGRFNRLQEWAIAHYGIERLQAAIQRFDPAGYSPPVNRRPKPFLFPQAGDWRFTHPVTPDAVEIVEVIREEAQAKGWSDERLYQNRGRFRFPLGQDYGLVCFVAPDKQPNKITESYIELIHTLSLDWHATRFYNADVFPPRPRINGAPE